MKPELTLCYVDAERIGYGRLGIQLERALTAAGVDVYDDLNPPPDKARLGDKQKREEGGHRHKVTNSVCWVSVPSHAPGWRSGQHPSIFTMWEATRLPETFRESLHCFDRVIVPSMQNVELFSPYHDNVAYCPLGVDPDVWHYIPRPEPGAFFEFLCGGSGARKGNDVAYEAFVKVFGDFAGPGPIPRLTLKLPKGEGDWPHPNVQVVSGYLDSEDEAALYARTHCYVQPSRGEGFGLQPLQAMAMGIPTILTAAHGHASFSHLGWEVDSRLEDTAYFNWGDAGQWWEPSVDDVADHMRSIYDNYTAATKLAKESAAVIADQFTWANVAETFTSIMGDELTTPYSGDGTWVDLELKRYRIVVQRPYKADIAGTQYHWEPGREYWDPAETKRLLYEAGVLAPECLGDEDGLLPSQVEAIPDYSAAMSYCQSCGQRLNSAPTRADDILAEMDAKPVP